MKEQHDITGADMLNGNFQETQWIAKGFVPAEGVTVLTGSPKFGKSLMALDLAASCATGRPAWGDVETQKTGALYLSLLDGEPSLGRRLRAQGFADPDEWVPTIFNFGVPKLEDGFIKWLEAALNRHPATGLVVIDPVESVSAGSIAGALAALRQTAERAGVAVLAVFQRPEAEDHADTCISLEREDKGKGRLRLTGRDTAEQDFPMTFDKTALRWRLG